MGQRSKIREYPPELRDWLDSELVRRGFADYVQLAADLVKQGEQLGKAVEASKSGLQRYGKDLEHKLQAIKDSTAAARLIAKEAPDDADERSAALNALTQTELFNIIISIRELDDETDLLKRAKLLSALTGNISKLTRSSVYQKKHQIEVRDKVNAAAAAAMKIAKKGGISKAGADELFRVITGIASS